MIISPARPEHLALIEAFREEASAWLARRGIDQWREPWPNTEAMRKRIAASIRAGQTWIVWDDSQPVASLALDSYANPRLWTPDERTDPARYLHRLTVCRSHAGQNLGGHILDWACNTAHHNAAKWVRIDVWTGNHRLQAYYRTHGFQPVRTIDLPDYPSGALLQRPALPVADTRLTQYDD